MKKRCYKCKFWENLGLSEDKNAHPDDVQGMCTRFPPSLDTTWLKECELEGVLNNSGYSYIDYRHWNQPVTPGRTFCGEWKKR